MRKLYFTLAFIILTTTLHAQQAFSFKPIIYGYHPYADLNNQIAPKAIGSAGTFALEPGAIVGYENYFLNPFMGAKLNLAFYSDNAGKISGFAHLGFRIRTFSNKQSFALSIGPTYFMRESWSDVADYTQDEKWNNSGTIESKFIALSGELEYSYEIAPNHRVTLTFAQINVKAFTFSIGYSFWAEKIKKSRKKNRRKSKYYKRRRRRS